ncbi:hypothetical protein C2845_PM01G41350 [Panicum miliaceum]|uniref:Uncharacterized protein n=1 Tax=Panicum miliaceum TaxID=4540 RepID=A0A3L6TPA3_PANMI|nr:hypothetical protein C2845_PM01G41350 [Panicum miliaceum]
MYLLTPDQLAPAPDIRSPGLDRSFFSTADSGCCCSPPRSSSLAADAVLVVPTGVALDLRCSGHEDFIADGGGCLPLPGSLPSWGRRHGQDGVAVDTGLHDYTPSPSLCFCLQSLVSGPPSLGTAVVFAALALGRGSVPCVCAPQS